MSLSNSEVYTNNTTDADDPSYYKKRKRYSRLGLVRVFSRGKKKSEELRGKVKKYAYWFIFATVS